MATVIVFYSLTGRTRKVCAALVERLGAEVAEIEAPKVRPGVWSMVRWGWAAMRDRRTLIQARVPAFDTGDTVILAAQVWAGRVSVPMRSWLDTAPPLPERVALVLTSGDKRFPQAAFDRFAMLTDRAPVARLHVSRADADAGLFTPQIDAFCKALEG